MSDLETREQIPDLHLSLVLAGTCLDGFASFLEDHDEFELAGRVKSRIAAFLGKGSGNFHPQLSKVLSDTLAMWERDLWLQARKRPFDRLLVKRYSHMLCIEGVGRDETRDLSRRVLPGLFAAFAMMTSRDFSERCQRESRTLLKRVRDQVGKDFQWKDLYHQPDAERLIDEFAIEIASYFSDFDKRLNWMVKIINNNLTPYEELSRPTAYDKEWVLNEAGLRKILKALYAPLSLRASDSDHRQGLYTQYGRSKIDPLLDLIEKLH